MEPLPARLPLVIGVTGHRDLRDQDVPELERQVAAIIARLRRDYLGGDRSTPIVVLSALAEGADRLVARVALAEGARLIAPLPLPPDEYRRDFEPGLKPGNIAEFEQLLAQAISAPVMPFTPGNSLDAVRADGKKRAEQYRAVGIFITQHCQVLLALWDGNTEDMAAGGSAEIVTFNREGIPLTVSGSPRASLDASEIGPVIEIVTPRLKAGSPADQVAVRPWGKDVTQRHRGSVVERAARRMSEFVAHLFRRDVEDERSKLSIKDRRELETWEHFEALLELTHQFNQDAVELEQKPDGPQRVTRSIDHLFTDPDGGTVESIDAKQHASERAPLWCRLYGTADTLALDRQAQFKLDWQLLFGLGFIAFFCFAMFTHAGYVTKLLLGSYLATFVAMIVVHVLATRGQHQERYLDYRALTEALRVAVYWKLIGIGARYLDAKGGSPGRQLSFDINPVGAIADAYPIKQSSELAWVKVCLRTLERLDKPGDTPLRWVDPVGHAIARRFWVRDQFAYFKRQGYRHNKLAEDNQTAADLLVLVSTFVLLPLLLFDVLHKWSALEHAVLIIVGLLPGLAAAWAGYGERLALKAQARQYDRMRVLFERAYDLLPQKIDQDSEPDAYILYRELGIESMRENAEWVAIYRQRPIQPPQG
jgi:hypothetical protein